MSIGAVSAGRLDISAVVSDSFGVIKRHGKDLLLASLLLVVLPAYLSLAIRYAWRDDPSSWIRTLVESAVELIPGAVLSGALFSATARDLDGKSASLEDVLRIGFKVCLPMIGLTLLVTIAVTLGMVFLIAPGVYLMLRWCVAGPALVSENLGVFESMKRSARLTKGPRWAILLGFLVVVVIYAAYYGLELAVAGSPKAVTALAMMRSVTPTSLVLLGVASPALAVAVSIGLNVFLGALHHRLSGGAEGSVAAVAEVFA